MFCICTQNQPESRRVKPYFSAYAPHPSYPLAPEPERRKLITESRAEVTEDIRHFQPLAGHGLAVRRVTGPAWLAR